MKKGLPDAPQRDHQQRARRRDNGRRAGCRSRRASQNRERRCRPSRPGRSLTASKKRNSANAAAGPRAGGHHQPQHQPERDSFVPDDVAGVEHPQVVGGDGAGPTSRPVWTRRSARRAAADSAADLAGHINIIHPERLQVMGQAEYEWAMRIGERRFGQMFKDLLCAAPPAVIVADGLSPPELLVESCEETHTPLIL